MCHEIGHMYGLSHCIYFECLMNGSNHLQEADKRPSFLCPLCLNKLYFITRFDIEKRYRKMMDFWGSHGLQAEVKWLQTRLDIVLGSITRSSGGTFSAFGQCRDTKDLIISTGSRFCHKIYALHFCEAKGDLK